MSTLSDGRHLLKINNSNGKCLLENWFEERATGSIDAAATRNGDVSGPSAKSFKEGHPGILSTDFNAKADKLTTYIDSYRRPYMNGARERGEYLTVLKPCFYSGSRTELMEKILYEQIRQDVDREFQAPQIPMPQESVTHEDYNIPDFIPSKPIMTAPHDYTLEQPVSFWTEHREKIHGVSQSKSTFDSPFRRNVAFSKPIGEKWDQAEPYEHDHVPNM